MLAGTLRLLMVALLLPDPSKGRVDNRIPGVGNPASATRSNVGTPSVLPPTTSYISAEASFLLKLDMYTLEESRGLLNTNDKVAAFATYMESLTQDFAEEKWQKWQKVVAMCRLVTQRWGSAEDNTQQVLPIGMIKTQFPRTIRYPNSSSTSTHSKCCIFPP